MVQNVTFTKLKRKKTHKKITSLRKVSIQMILGSFKFRYLFKIIKSDINEYFNSKRKKLLSNFML